MRRMLFFVCLFLLLQGCGGPQAVVPQVDGAYSYVDDYGTQVVVPACPQRIVSVSPAVTAILFDLGAAERLVGRTDYCTYPAEVEEIASIGGISNLNIEMILSLQPDLVISGSMIPRESVAALNALGVPMVCVIEQPRFDSLYSNISKIGRLVGCEERARQLCDSLRGRMQVVERELRASLASQRRPRVYYVVGFGKGGNFTAGGNTFINDVIALAGGENIARDVKGWNISAEALFERDPDYIVVRREDAAAFCKMAPYNKLRAVREGHVIPIESGLLDLQTPRNMEAVEYLFRAMHGGR